MPIRIVVTQRTITSTTRVCTRSVDFESICSYCLTSDKEKHTCSLCVNCCECALCRCCGELLVLSACTACGLCRTCCTCWACRRCNAPHTHKSLLCTLCGFGGLNGCNCCQHGRRTTNNGISRITGDINLARYVAEGPKDLRLNPSTRLISAEIEICGIRGANHDQVNHALQSWHCSVVGDGSLPIGGFEINTHPAAGDYFVDQIRDICAGLATSKAFVDQQAGCHTHVDARDLGYTQLASLLRITACVEAALFQMIPNYRRTSHYCQYWAPNYLRQIHRADANVLQYDQSDRRSIVAYRRAVLEPLYGSKDKAKIVSARRSKGNGPRYRGTNVHSWTFRGTIEYRIPCGTIYPDNIINWGILLANLVDLASGRTRDEIKELTKDVEIMIAEQSLYSTDIHCLPTPFVDASMDLLRNLAPTSTVRDWITERIKWAKAVRTFSESY